MDEHEHVPVGSEHLHNAQGGTESPQEDKHAKHVIWLVVTFFALLVLVGVLLLSTLSIGRPAAPLPVTEDPVEKPVAYVVPAECTYASDGEAYMDSIQNPNACACINDDTKRKSCETVASNRELYARALNELNPDLCNQITIDEQKQNCHTFVETQDLDLRDSNPQYLADTYFNSGQYDKALSIYEEAVESGIESAQLYARIGLTYAYLSAGVAEGEYDSAVLEKAHEAMALAIAEDPTDIETYVIEGNIYRDFDQEFDAAIELYTKGLELNPEYVQAYYERAKAYEYKAENGNALADYETVLELETDGAWVISTHTTLCRMYGAGEQIQKDKALASCEIAIELNEIPAVVDGLNQIVNTIQ